MRNVASIVFLSLLAIPGVCPAAEDGLVGYWRFDAATSSVADLSGHGHAAQVSGGKVVTENGKKVLALDGKQTIVVPSSPELNLQPGFSMVAKVKISDLSNGRTIIFKESQYQLRVDQPEEMQRLSFFPYVDGQWESRVSSLPPTLGGWYHLVATWDGRRSVLWVNGIPFFEPRAGHPPTPNDSPLMIATANPQGGMGGAIEYAKIYRRVLSPKEIMSEAYGVARAAAAQSTPARFDFAAGADMDDWTACNGATAAIAENRLVVAGKTPYSLVMNSRLCANIGKKDFVSLRMSVDKGSRAKLIFVTTKGAGEIAFPTFADRKPHAYVLDAWTQVGWEGNLLALGLIPSEFEACTARIEYLEIGETPRAAPEIHVDRIFTESTLPRAQRPERIIARMHNPAGPARNLIATLSAPEGIVLKGPSAQAIASIEHNEEAEVAWDVETVRPVSGSFRVTVAERGQADCASSEQTLAFHANPHLAKADYVPPPVPAKTKYTLWTHYCPLWKQGTHTGWQKIEPWPERKPAIGWYNEGTPEVADWHIKYMREHGISDVVYCWYRSNLNGPVQQSIGHAIHDGLLKARYLSMIKFAIMWENGCGQGVGSAEDLMQNVLPFWIDNYFSNPSYARIDGKPVLYVWVPSNVTRHLGGSENVRKTFDRMRAECKRRGVGGLYLVGCVGSQDKAALETMAKEGWDASSAYGNSWRPPEKVTPAGDYICAPFEGFIDQQEAIWKFKRQLHLLPDITAAMMGWDSRPWKETPFFWSDNTPEKFRDLCRRAKAVMDSSAAAGPEKNTAIFCCWNEFGEGHYIEPTRGYGFSYLDVIRDVFCEGPKEHVDVVPEDVGLPVSDSWYRAARQQERDITHQANWSGEQLTAWKGTMGLDQAELRDGVLRATSTNQDPAFFSPAIELRASRYAKVVVEMRLSRPTGDAQLFWSTATSPQATEAASVHAKTIADGQWHTYVFAVGENPAWGGCITSLRFDPATEKSVTVEIKSIRLE